MSEPVRTIDLTPLVALREQAEAEPLPEHARSWNRHELADWPRRRYVALLEDAYLAGKEQ